MARPAKVWLRKQTGWYCTTIRGEVVKLSKDRDEAQRRFYELMATKGEPEATTKPPERPPLPLSRLADEFLDATQADRSEHAQEHRRRYLARLVAFAGDPPAALLLPHDVTRWLKSNPKWGPSTRSFLRRIVKSAYNWALSEGLLADNPLAKMRLGKVERRDRLLTVEQRAAVSRLVSPRYRDFFLVLERTGCRPFSELAMLTAADLDLDAGTATIQKHKNRKKVGRARVIYLVPEVVAVLRKLAAERPTGLLFRSPMGYRIRAENARKVLQRASSRAGFHVMPYDYRHTFITEALIRGVPVEVVAELVGNSPAVIHRHYAHVAKDKDALRAAAAKAVGATTPATPPTTA